MGVFSTLLGSGNVLVGPTAKPIDRSALNRDPISTTPLGWSPSRLKMNKGIEAVATASRESVACAAPNLFPLGQSVAAAAAAAVFDYKKAEEEEEKKRRKDSVTADQMDHWLRESIGEIVRNIGEAPFLVQIFSQGPSVLRLEKEEASPESWPIVKKRWDQTNRTPDGVILVEELTDNDDNEAIDDNNDDDGDNNANDSQSQGGCSRKWGLVVQGRGMDCAASCYILNTCRVRSSAGFCTHFCLVRAKCFGESFDKQLGRAWLQGR